MSNPAPATCHLVPFAVGNREQSKPKRLSKQAQIVAMQDSLFKLVNSEAIECRERAQAACAWERLQNRLDKMRMKPEPRPIDTEALSAAKAKKRQATREAGPLEAE